MENTGTVTNQSDDLYSLDGILHNWKLFYNKKNVVFNVVFYYLGTNCEVNLIVKHDLHKLYSHLNHLQVTYVTTQQMTLTNVPLSTSHTSEQDLF